MPPIGVSDFNVNLVSRFISTFVEFSGGNQDRALNTGARVQCIMRSYFFPAADHEDVKDKTTEDHEQLFSHEVFTEFCWEFSTLLSAHSSSFYSNPC